MERPSFYTVFIYISGLTDYDRRFRPVYSRFRPFTCRLHAVLLDLGYAEQFLVEKNCLLPRLLNLGINYESLAMVIPFSFICRCFLVFLRDKREEQKSRRFTTVFVY
jgi:hypothetical protein